MVVNKDICKGCYYCIVSGNACIIHKKRLGEVYFCYDYTPLVVEGAQESVGERQRGESEVKNGEGLGKNEDRL